MKFNVMEHKMVPEHHLVSEKEEEKVLQQLRVTKEQLPKITKSDPCIEILERKHGPIEEGRLIMIRRESRTAGETIAYRVVMRR